MLRKQKLLQLIRKPPLHTEVHHLYQLERKKVSLSFLSFLNYFLDLPNIRIGWFPDGMNTEAPLLIAWINDGRTSDRSMTRCAGWWIDGSLLILTRPVSGVISFVEKNYCHCTHIMILLAQFYTFQHTLPLDVLFRSEYFRCCGLQMSKLLKIRYLMKVK